MLIADAEIAAEIKRSTRTLARWDAGKKGTPKGWPQAVSLVTRNIGGPKTGRLSGILAAAATG